MKFFRIQILPLVIFAQEYNETFIMSQGNRRSDHLQMADKTIVGVVIGMQSEGEHTTKSRVHLRCGNCVTGMGFQSGIGNKADALYSLQILCHLHCICVMLLHPQGQCNGTAHNQPCIKRADCST